MSASGGAGGLGGSQAVNVAQVQASAAKEDVQEIIANQEQSDISMVKDSQDMANPAAATRIKKKEDKFQSLETRKKAATEKSSTKTETTEDKPEADVSDRFVENNPEISGQDLQGLRDSLREDASPEDVLKMVQEKFADPALQSIALDYLVQTTPSSDGALKSTLIQARQQHITNNHQAVTGGKNIMFASQEYAEALNVSPSGLRELYLTITSDFHSVDQILTMLQSRYTHEEMGTVSSFLLRGMSADLKSEGPSVPPAKLQVMMTEIRNLQALISSYDYFDSHVPPLLNSLKAEGAAIPDNIQPKQLADVFLKAIQDKFPTASKIERSVREAVGDDSESVSGVLNLFFKALRGTSPRLFSSAEKRQQLGAMMANALDSVNINNEDYPKASDFPKPYPWS